MSDRNRHKDSTVSRPTIPPDTAVSHLPSHLILWVVCGGFLALDLWSKAWAFRSLQPDDTRARLFGLITFRRSMNPGALFGMGEGLVYVFILASVVALGFVLYLFACSSRRQHVLHLGLGMILAGALGNLHDRVLIRAHRVVFKPGPAGEIPSYLGEVIGDPEADPVRIRPWDTGEHPVASHPRDEIESIQSVGVVRDFIKFEPRLFGREVWPWVFNVADALLTVGVGILLLCFWSDHRRQRACAGAKPAIDRPPR